LKKLQKIVYTTKQIPKGPVKETRNKKEKRKNNAKKGGFLAIFGQNLEKKDGFEQGFQLNC
jgi:hypothetical protein